ncbi:hypothetical protein COMA1_60053 [Candidatus Nitrospira nitrosa]|uniref:Uncharacterized protein n=1 Tax=Candidatus Nitrospira nitrosa TaxID=1742972 RepID=A0A0S4LUR5_9BACT|nr:hypothetical protein COMA1_60053 [Candidatus Nitrospira nitrosa]
MSSIIFYLLQTWTYLSLSMCRAKLLTIANYIFHTTIHTLSKAIAKLTVKFLYTLK